jgi:hypothetical protein
VEDEPEAPPEQDDAEASAAEEAEEAEAEVDEPQPFPIVRRRRGGALGAAMLGLHEIIYGPQKNQIVIVADADGMPEPDFDIQLTPDPRDSVVIMRKHWWHKRT